MLLPGCGYSETSNQEHGQGRMQNPHQLWQGWFLGRVKIGIHPAFSFANSTYPAAPSLQAEISDQCHRPDSANGDDPGSPVSTPPHTLNISLQENNRARDRLSLAIIAKSIVDKVEIASTENKRASSDSGCRGEHAPDS